LALFKKVVHLERNGAVVRKLLLVQDHRAFQRLGTLQMIYLSLCPSWQDLATNAPKH